MKTPEVSVIMTSFNAAKDITASINSILDQRFTNFEFIIIDDGSTDDTPNLLRAYKDSRLKITLRGINRGQTASLNEALRLAKAPLVARQDSDDISHRDRLSLQVAIFSANPDLLLLGTQGVVCDDSGVITGLLSVPLGSDQINGWFNFDNPIIHASAMFRREPVISQLGGYDEKLKICQDYDLWLRMSKTGRIDNTPQRLLAYRIHPGSLSRAGAERTRSEAGQIRQKARDRQLKFAPNSRTRALMGLNGPGGRDGLARATDMLRGAAHVLHWITERKSLIGRTVEEWRIAPVSGN